MVSHVHQRNKNKCYKVFCLPVTGYTWCLENKSGVAPLSWKCYVALTSFKYYWTCSKVHLFSDEPRCLKPHCQHLIKYRSCDIVDSLYVSKIQHIRKSSNVLIFICPQVMKIEYIFFFPEIVIYLHRAMG